MKTVITLRLDKDVLDDLRKEAKAKEIGYQTLLNIILRDRMSKKTKTRGDK